MTLTSHMQTSPRTPARSGLRGQLRYLAFRLGAQRFVLSADHVVSVLDGCAVQPPREACAAGAIGVLEFAGRRLPVFDVASWLGIEMTHQEHIHTVIAASDHGQMALRVGDVSRLVKVAADQRCPLPPPLDALVPDRFRSLVVGATDETSPTRELTAADRPETASTPFDLELNPHVFLALNSAAGRASVGAVATDVGLSQSASKVPPAPAPQAAAAKRRLSLFAPSPSEVNGSRCLFGISASQVLEVCRPLPITPVPGAEDWIHGLVRWRSAIVPVLKLAELFGLEELPADGLHRLLIARVPGSPALMAARVSPSIRMESLPLPHVPCRIPQFNADFVHGSYQLESEVLVMPNLSRLLQPALVAG